MTLSDATITVTDGNLATGAGGSDGVHVALGCCSSGTANVLYGFGSSEDVKTRFGSGPLVEALCFALASRTPADGGKSPATVYGMRVAAATAGSSGPVRTTRVGSSTGAVTVSSGVAYDRFRIKVEILSTGARGVATFRYSVDDGNTWSGTRTTAATYLIDEANVTLAFSSGTYDDGDLFELRTLAPQFDDTTLDAAFDALEADTRTWEFAHVVGAPAPASTAVTAAGTTPPTVTVSGTPADYFDVVVAITTGGSRGTAVFKYSLDGGATYTTGISTAATYEIPLTGLTLAFASGTYATDNEYAFNTGNASGFASLCATVGTWVSALPAAHRYAFAVLDAPDAPDAALAAAVSGVTNKGLVAAAGYALQRTGSRRSIEHRSLGNVVAARIAAIPISEDPGHVGVLGPLDRVTGLGRDERVTPGLDAARCATARTRIGRPGFYLEACRTLAQSGSDYAQIADLRVIFAACRVADPVLQEYVRSKLRVNAATGRILEQDAARVDTRIENALAAALVGQDLESTHCSGITVRTNRTDNLLSTKTLRVKISIIPLSHPEAIEAEIGLENPALATV